MLCFSMTRCVYVHQGTDWPVARAASPLPFLPSLFSSRSPASSACTEEGDGDGDEAPLFESSREEKRGRRTMRGKQCCKTQSLGDCIRLDSSPSCLSLRSPLFLSFSFFILFPFKRRGRAKKVIVFFYFYFYFRLKSLGTKILLDDYQ